MGEQQDLADFAAAAEAYCTVIESAEGRARRDVLFDLGITLPALYAASLRLPDRYSEIETPAHELPRRDVSATVERRCQEILGDHGGDEFWRFVNLMDGWDEPKRTSKRRGKELPPHSLAVLADQLAELYLLLVQGRHLIAKGAEDEAVWEWRVHWHMWGNWVLSALLTVHACLVAESARTLVRGGPNFPVPPEPQAP